MTSIAIVLIEKLLKLVQQFLKKSKRSFEKRVLVINSFKSPDMEKCRVTNTNKFEKCTVPVFLLVANCMKFHDFVSQNKKKLKKSFDFIKLVKKTNLQKRYP